MYGFSEDEKTLVFMDCFGLTRLSRPKQVKTDGKISGSESAGRVTISRDGSFAASYEDLWDKSVIWALPELADRLARLREAGVIDATGLCDPVGVDAARRIRHITLDDLLAEHLPSAGIATEP